MNQADILKHCKYIFVSETKKGQVYNIFSRKGDEYCSKHSPQNILSRNAYLANYRKTHKTPNEKSREYVKHMAKDIQRKSNNIERVIKSTKMNLKTTEKAGQ